MRKLLVEAIFDLSSDEYETVDDVLDLAKMSETELVGRLIAIACFYRNQLNDVTN